MFASDFQSKLQKLNPRLRIFCGDSPTRPAGLYIIQGNEYTDLCGVDKNWIGEWPIYDRYGKMLKGGWRRVIKLLSDKKLIDRQRSHKYFGYWEEHREPPIFTDLKPIDAAIKSMERQVVSYRKIDNPLSPGELIEVPVYHKDDIVDIGRMAAKE